MIRAALPPNWRPPIKNQDQYAALIDGLCARIGSDLSSKRHLRMDLTVNDTPFSLVPSADLEGHIDAIVFFAEVGTLPERGRAKATIGLLKLNLYYFGPEAPRYCCNPEKPGVVVMAGRLPVPEPSSLHPRFRLRHLHIEDRVHKIRSSTRHLQQTSQLQPRCPHRPPRVPTEMTHLWNGVQA